MPSRRPPRPSLSVPPSSCGALSIVDAPLAQALWPSEDGSARRVSAELAADDGGWLGDATAYVGPLAMVRRWAVFRGASPGLHAYLTHVEVRSDHWRRGCGRALLTALLEVLKARGVRSVGLIVDPFHGGPPWEVLVPWYQSLGFRHVGGVREMRLEWPRRAPRRSPSTPTPRR